jgi:aarF domain-containing kinase
MGFNPMSFLRVAFDHLKHGCCLQDNWLHADLHPGNIIVLEQPGMSVPAWVAQAVDMLSSFIGYGVPTWSSIDLKLAIIDVGMTVSLQRHHYLALIQLYDGIAELDGTTVGKSMLKLRYHETNVRDLDLDTFRSDIEGIFRDMDRKQFREQTQEVCGCVLEAMRRHRVTMDAAASSVLLTTLALEGWATKLDPDIRILEKICELIPRDFVHRIPAVVDLLVHYDLLQLE